MENYVLYEELPSCAQGCVHYKGRRRRSIHFVSIEKCDKANKEAVANAVRMSHNLRHDNMRLFMEWYETPQHIWVISELCSGGSLDDILVQDGCLPEKVVWGFIRQVAAGLQYLHSNGILYCDLRPTKVHLDSLGTLKLTDFSHSCLSEEPPQCHPLLPLKGAVREETETNRATRESSSTSSVHECSQHPSDSEPEMRPHTPGAILSQKEAPEHHTVDRHGALSAPYLAPECRSGQHPTECSDLWGLGCLSYHLYCGYCPQERCPPSALNSSVYLLPARSQADGQPPSRDFSSFVKKLLKVDPRQRPSWRGLVERYLTD